MKYLYLFILCFIFSIVDAQNTSFCIDYNLSKDNSTQTIIFPPVNTFVSKQLTHGFSIYGKKNIGRYFSIGTGYRFKENWISTTEGHYLKLSNLISHNHSIPFLLDYRITPFNKGVLSRFTVLLNGGIFFNYYKKQLFDDQLFSTPLSVSNNAFSSFYTKKSVTLESSIVLSFPIYRTIDFRIGLSRHFGFKPIVEKQYFVTEFTGYVENGIAISKGGYSSLLFGLSYTFAKNEKKSTL